MTPTPLISLKNISRYYQLGSQKIEVLKNISLNIYPGEFIAVVGPSGSGKSTLLYLLGLLDKPNTGTIEYNGQDITSLSDNELAHLRNQQVGFVFQQYNLLKRHSAVENVLLPTLYSSTPPQTAKTKALTLLKKIGLGDRSNHQPSQLSGGQQQRVAIARALINDPQIIIADEPTGNLDSKSGREILALLSSLNQGGRSLVIVTHDQSVAKIAKRIINIKDGKLIKRDNK